MAAKRLSAPKENFFQESPLAGLRETAFEVESRHNPAESDAPEEASLAHSADGKAERVLVLLTPDPSTAALIRRGKRVADYLKGECLAVAICPKGLPDSLPPPEREALEKHLQFAVNLHVSTHLLSGENVAQELASFAQQHAVMQIYTARPKLTRWAYPFRSGIIRDITRLAGDIEITIVAERQPLR